MHTISFVARKNTQKNKERERAKTTDCFLNGRSVHARIASLSNATEPRKRQSKQVLIVVAFVAFGHTIAEY